MTRQLTLITTDYVTVSLRFIESIHLERPESDQVVDTLKGDIVFGISTIGGKKYNVSVKEQMTHYGHAGLNVKDVSLAQEAIFERWLKLIE